MSTKNPWKIDRAGWAPGPWDAEPEDRVEWRSRGFACLAVRNMMGAWCGYVGVPPGHPWHRQEESADRLECVEAHGGLTYSGPCDEDGVICHVPEPGEPDEVWWLGFDTAHSGDLCPSYTTVRLAGMRSAMKSLGRGETYRDLAYVRAEVERLVEQAEAARA